MSNDFSGKITAIDCQAWGPNSLEFQIAFVTDARDTLRFRLGFTTSDNNLDLMRKAFKALWDSAHVTVTADITRNLPEVVAIAPA